MSNDVGAAIQALAGYDEKSMCKEIALRAAAVRADAALGGEPNLRVVEDAAHLGITEDLVQLGNRIFRRIEREVHDLLCGTSADDKKDRESILSKITGGDAALGAALYGVLTASLGMAPAVATVVAALLIKRIFTPAGKEVCAFWAEKIKQRS